MGIRQTAAAAATALMLAAAPSVAHAANISISFNGLAAKAEAIPVVTYGEPTNADVVGGALVAGKVAVPWAIFRMAVDTTSPALHQALTQGVHIQTATLVTRNSASQGGVVSYTLHDVVITSIKAVAGSNPPQEDVRITYATKTSGVPAITR